MVAANNADAPATATFATFNKNAAYSRPLAGRYGRSLRTDDEGRVTVTVPPLSVRGLEGARRR